jgi:hypothetical protein
MCPPTVPTRRKKSGPHKAPKLGFHTHPERRWSGRGSRDGRVRQIPRSADRRPYHGNAKLSVEDTQTIRLSNERPADVPRDRGRVRSGKFRVPHQQINASPDNTLECVLARSDNEAAVVNLNIEPRSRKPFLASIRSIAHDRRRARQG